MTQIHNLYNNLDGSHVQIDRDNWITMLECISLTKFYVWTAIRKISRRVPAYHIRFAA